MFTLERELTKHSTTCNVAREERIDAKYCSVKSATKTITSPTSGLAGDYEIAEVVVWSLLNFSGAGGAGSGTFL
jgi:hypothetical protein